MSRNGGGYVDKCVGKASFVEYFKNPPRSSRWVGEAFAVQFQNDDVAAAAAESETATERRDAGGRSQREKRNGSPSVSKASTSSFA